MMLHFAWALTFLLWACIPGKSAKKSDISGSAQGSASSKEFDAIASEGEESEEDIQHRSDFIKLCESKESQENAYTVQVFMSAYALKTCLDVYSIISTAASIKIENTSRILPEFRKPGEQLHNFNIRDLSIFAYARNLSSLDLWQQSVSDLSPLKNLQNLRTLRLIGNDVRNLSPLSQLSKLSYLDLSENRNLSDLNPLRALSSLKFLLIKRTRVTSLDPISQLSNLEMLDISDSFVESIDPIAGLTKLKHFDANYNNQLSLGTPLKGLISLEYLNLTDTLIHDLSFLSGMIRLQRFFVDSTSDTDLSLISKLIALKELKIRINRTDRADSLRIQTNFAHLKSLTALELLSVSDPGLSDVSFLSFMPNLRSLTLYGGTIQPQALASLKGLSSLETYTSNLSRTTLASFSELNDLVLTGGTLQGLDFSSLKKLKTLQIEDLESADSLIIAGATGLVKLAINESVIARNDLSPLSTLTNLQDLDLSSIQQPVVIRELISLKNLHSLAIYGAPNSDLTGIEAFTNLDELFLEGVLRGSCEVISGLINLRLLNIANGGLTDLSCISRMKSLIRLQASENFQLKSLSPLSNTPSLEKLEIRNNQVSNVKILESLKYLKEVKLYRNPIVDLESLSKLPRLKLIETPDQVLAGLKSF